MQDTIWKNTPSLSNRLERAAPSIAVSKPRAQGARSLKLGGKALIFRHGVGFALKRRT
jgi:hypothetical protein